METFMLRFYLIFALDCVRIEKLY